MNMSNEQVDRLLESVSRIATGLKYLGTGDAATTMGAIEFLAKETGDGLNNVASAINNLAAAVRGE